MEIKSNTFGYRLKQLRHRANLKQEELGNILGVNKATISRYEHNVLEVNYDTLGKLSNLFGVTPNYLLGTEQKEAPLLPIDTLTTIEEAYLNKVKTDINEIMNKLNIIDILMFKSILTSNCTLEQFLSSLKEFESIQQNLPNPQNKKQY